MPQTTATDMILSTWNRLHHLPGGIWLFNLALRMMNPYSGSIRARVTELRPGYARVLLKDKHRIRNHLNSIHALALANLGELASGLALLSNLPANTRGIPIKITTDYYIKARGMLTAESYSDLASVNETIEHDVFADIKNNDGDIVARTSVSWRLEPLDH